MTLFPDSLLADLRPAEIIDAWGESLPVMREKLRPDVDAFIERVLDFDKQEQMWPALREIDPRIMALYYDRLCAATFFLKTLREEKDVTVIPASWPTAVASLLFQMSLQ